MGRRNRERVAAIQRGEVAPIAGRREPETKPTPEQIRDRLKAYGLIDRFIGSGLPGGLILLRPKGR